MRRKRTAEMEDRLFILLLSAQLYVYIGAALEIILQQYIYEKSPQHNITFNMFFT
jgi:hypothetical protein